MEEADATATASAGARASGLISSHEIVFSTQFNASNFWQSIINCLLPALTLYYGFESQRRILFPVHTNFAGSFFNELPLFLTINQSTQHYRDSVVHIRISLSFHNNLTARDLLTIVFWLQPHRYHQHRYCWWHYITHWVSWFFQYMQICVVFLVSQMPPHKSNA